jgi:hypothetical protein
LAIAIHNPYKKRKMKVYKFNLNYHILVKLTEDGYKRLMQDYNWVFDQYPNMAHLKQPLEYFKSRENADGYVEFQMWQFMQIFGGDHIDAGRMPPFATDILIKECYLTPLPEE